MPPSPITSRSTYLPSRTSPGLKAAPAVGCMTDLGASAVPSLRVALAEDFRDNPPHVRARTAGDPTRDAGSAQSLEAAKRRPAKTSSLPVGAACSAGSPQRPG